MPRAYALFREQKPYSIGEIADKLAAPQQEAALAVRDLMSSGILRYRNSDVTDEWELANEDGASNEQRLQFCFVGIAIARNLVFVIYPKYIQRDDGPSRLELKQCLQVIRALGNDGVLPEMDAVNRSTNRLAVLMRLLQLYDEYGVYTNFEDTRELNGNGVIDWQKTIDSQIPMLSQGAPIYLDVWTRKTARNETDFITRLHSAILTECSCFLRNCGLGELLGITEIELTAETAADFGDTAMLDRLLECERAEQYVTWKQEALDLMRSYLDTGGAAARDGEVLQLGTTSYYHAWELACKTAFNDQLETRLGDLPITLAGSWHNRANETLLEIIPRPLWESPRSTGGYSRLNKVDTLIPDIVTFSKAGERSKVFRIFDAKYYVPAITTTGKILGQPGLESITKQFLYQSAYRDFVEQNKFDSVENFFLVPNDGNRLELLARVSFSDVMQALTAEVRQFDSFIYMWSVPAYDVFQCYLNGNHLDELLFELMDSSEMIEGGSVDQSIQYE